MKTLSKAAALVLATAIMASSVASTASAQQQQQQQQRVGIFPLLAGPIGLGAAVGASTTTLTWTTLKWIPYKIWVPGKWIKIGYKWKYIPGHKKWVKVPKKVHHSQTNRSNSAQGKAIVGCIFGSALGAITSSMRKATAMGNPPRWRSQAEHERIVASGYEKQFELTNDEANTAVALCGLGSFALHWPQRP
jgi:hypothetical protein